MITIQTLTLGKQRFVAVLEKDFQRLQKRAGARMVRSEFAKEAMRELQTYRKTGKESQWKNVKHRLGL